MGSHYSLGTQSDYDYVVHGLGFNSVYIYIYITSTSYSRLFVAFYLLGCLVGAPLFVGPKIPSTHNKHATTTDSNRVHVNGEYCFEYHH